MRHRPYRRARQHHPHLLHQSAVSVVAGHGDVFVDRTGGVTLDVGNRLPLGCQECCHELRILLDEISLGVADTKCGRPTKYLEEIDDLANAGELQSTLLERR